MAARAEMRSFGREMRGCFALQTRVAQCEVTIDPSVQDVLHQSDSCNPLHVGLCKSSGNLHPLRGRSSMIVRSTRSVVCACLVALLFERDASHGADHDREPFSVTSRTARAGSSPARLSSSSANRAAPSRARGHQRNRRLRLPERHAGHLHRRSHDGRLQDRAARRASGQRRRPRHRSGTDARTGRRRRKRSTSPPRRRSSRRERRAVVRRLDRRRSRTCRSAPRQLHRASSSFTPGVIAGGASAGGTRLGGVGQNNIMMDGISAMDTGNNGQMLNMNIESIAEVKVLTQGYQAEYGRSSGLQITAVTKSGTNRFRGSAYDIKTNSDWNENSWVNAEERRPQADQQARHSTATRSAVRSASPAATTSCSSSTRTSTVRPTPRSTAATRSGSACRRALERAGDFSQTLDNNGALFTFIRDTSLGRDLQRDRPDGCFRDGGVLGKIPANRLYPAGLAILNRYPLPNMHAGAGHATTTTRLRRRPRSRTSTQQPAIRLDYQLSSKLRVTGKYSGERAARADDARARFRASPTCSTPYPFITNYARHGQLRAQPDDLHRRHLRVHPQRAGRRQRERHPRQRLGEPADLAAGLPAASIRTPASSPTEYYALRGAGATSSRRSGTARRSTCRRSSTGAAASAPRRRTSAIPAG